MAELSLEWSLLIFGGCLPYYRPSEVVGELAMGPGGRQASQRRWWDQAAEV